MKTMMYQPIPTPDAETSARALRALLRERHPYAAVEVFHRALGEVFRIELPGFKPVFMAGPDAARFVLVEARDRLLWRSEGDPVTEVLGRGLLVVDGDEHDRIRAVMNPSLQRGALEGYAGIMQARAAQVTDTWRDGETLDMLAEMRKITLLVLMDALFDVDFTPELRRLWGPVLGVIRGISPGLWMVWPGAPRLRGPARRACVQPAPSGSWTPTSTVSSPDGANGWRGVGAAMTCSPCSCRPGYPTSASATICSPC